ncbi:anaerobic ribonucleoside-triphosphate reductase activating protein [Eubacterium sp.]|uniref:anaerobic ribonucleoside-triphosphate reductase activating protein n=1 Tax=Eubacterium sp. TaxID=142586 RepID=UPI001D93AE2B|nr:anaerobic ribonucleoside-triphosphate reductase activating protein [Eubacterium sp.]MBS5619884.1 anaerobic ribonucleoside-triphosphate reductase activating protein [Eubacterium sp.]
MRYAQIRSMDISNGEGVGVSLFVQGCPFHCKNCFNSETWDFNGGKEWTEETKNKFMELIDRPYIRRVSILGGEPLHENNLSEVLSLVKEIREKFPDKTIWLYTGYSIEDIVNFNTKPYSVVQQYFDIDNFIRNAILIYVDVLVDGEYIDEQKDLTLKFRGSKNQKVIDVKETLKQEKVVLYCD